MSIRPPLPALLSALSLSLLLAPGASGQDCNGNGVDDAIDLVSGTSFDCNRNGIPDDCDFCAGDLTLIDFEGPAEGTQIGNQYAADGVTFALLGTPAGLPIICTEGAPNVAFNAPGGADTPLGGLNGLTDPTGTVRGIEMQFSPPVLDLSFYLIDIDNSDQVEVRSFAGASLLSSQLVTSSDLETGNGIGTLVQVKQTGITRVEVDFAGTTNSGYALDTLLFRRPALNPGCDRFVRVSQESSPGAGDFDSNVLGYVELFPTASTVATQYSYDFPESDSYNGLLIPQVADRSNLALIETSDHGLSLFVYHDRAVPNDADGGRAEMAFDLAGDPDGAEIVLQDDPNDGSDVYTGAPGSHQFTARWAWNACCTDGLVLGDLEGSWSLILGFTEVGGSASTLPIQGLTTWRAHSADGNPVDLTLALDRRVRLDTSTGPCPLSLVPNVVDLSLSSGGVQTMTLDAGPANAGGIYFLLGSATGTQPGQDLGDVTLPLNPDPYFTLTLTQPNNGILFQQIGLLDAQGGAQALFVLPAGLPASFAGFVVHHAFTLLGKPFASNPSPIRLVP